MIILHFLKREFESLFIHRFSADTLPLRNVVKNSAHYWLLCGVNMGYFIYGPLLANKRHSTFFTFTMCAIWLWSEVENYWSHILLRDLRPPGSRERHIPRGHGFDTFKLSCPNYFFETIGWICVSLFSGSFSGNEEIFIVYVMTYI